MHDAWGVFPSLLGVIPGDAPRLGAPRFPGWVADLIVTSDSPFRIQAHIHTSRQLGELPIPISHGWGLPYTLF